MAYQINKTNGNVLVNLQDGTKDTTATSLTLVGKNYPGYGQFFNENFVRLIENFANGTEPSNKLIGQCWYDTSTGQLKFYNGTLFKATGAVTVAATAPTSNARGDFWYKSSTDQLYVYSGTGFKLIGPFVASNTGFSGLEPTTLTDSSGNTRNVTFMKNAGNEIGILSDAEFTLTSARAGYNDTTVRKGLTLKDNTTTGTAMLRSHVLSASNLSSTRVVFSGTDGDLTDHSGLTYTSGSSTLNVTNLAVSGAISGSALSSLQAGTVTIGTENSSASVFSVAFTSATSGPGELKVDNTGLTFQPSTNTLTATIFAGTSTTAKYADLAENYVTDAEYEPGTVVVIGGEKEATISSTDHNKKVLGVISTQPAYLMNSECVGQPIALRGRVPCKVFGVVNKGDLLVTSSVAGYAQVCAEEFETSRAVFAKALESKFDEGTGTIEVLVL
jgi:hypothetical protein